jgi:hypothetical protein
MDEIFVDPIDRPVEIRLDGRVFVTKATAVQHLRKVLNCSTTEAIQYFDRLPRRKKEEE